MFTATDDQKFEFHDLQCNRFEIACEIIWTSSDSLGTMRSNCPHIYYFDCTMDKADIG